MFLKFYSCVLYICIYIICVYVVIVILLINVLIKINNVFGEIIREVVFYGFVVFVVIVCESLNYFYSNILDFLKEYYLNYR